MSDTEKHGGEQGAGSGDFGSLFVQLVLSFHAAAWQQMGKVVSVVTGKVERDLTMAKHSIDMLGMLAEKTNGNLTEDEKKYLDQALFELRINYLEEQKKEAEKSDRQSQESKDSDGEGGTPPDKQGSDNE